MRAPAFWAADGVAPRLLAPLGWVYGAVAAKRLRRDAPRAALPTIVVGGLTAGGDGKTPLAILLAQLLSQHGERPAVLTRGYGARRPPSLPLAVQPEHDASLVGDEAPLLARHALTIVGADRAASATLAQELGATVVILDDGLHSRRLAADFSLLAVDAHFGAGNGLCLPAGPLRAPVGAQTAAVDALAVIGDGAAGETLAAQASRPAFRATFAPDVSVAKKISGARVVAFAGIGRPDKFFRTVRETGADLAAARSFPDHHSYSEKDFAGLRTLARLHRAELVTTEKDAARIPPGALDFVALPISLACADATALAAALTAALARARLSRVS